MLFGGAVSDNNFSPYIKNEHCEKGGFFLRLCRRKKKNIKIILYMEASAARFRNQTFKVEEPKRCGLLRIKIVYNACINHLKRTLLTAFFINVLLIKVKSFPQIQF